MGNFSIAHRLRNKLRVAKSTRIDIGASVKMSGCKVTVRGKNNTLIIGANSKLRDTVLEIMGDNCLIEIAEDNMIGHNCYLSAKGVQQRIVIEADCGLSRNVKIMTSDGHPVYSGGERVNHDQDVIIERHVWIGDNVTLLKGVRIGSGSVVGINATLTRSIPSKSIAVGNPARVVKEGITWEP